ncbi:kinase-like protein [Hypoxylon sp. FL0543]|nr:kinase-like protein [Hypoxylon sp. FL0543]
MVKRNRNISVKFGLQAPTPPRGRRRRRNLRRTEPDLDQLAVRESDKIKRYFQDYKKHYKFDTPIANGQHGVAVVVTRFARKDPPSPEISFVVKRAYDESGDAIEILENEIQWLKRLRGAPHVIQIVELEPDPFKDFNRPTLVTEYVENGTLTELIERASFRRRPVPNRILWAFYSCLVRTCIAMAWPDRGAAGELQANEQFPTDWKERPQRQLIHGDLHPDNIVIGELSPLADEHLVAPILKVVDWGLARVVPDLHNVGLGVTVNIFDISRIMRMLITLDTTFELEPKRVPLQPTKPDEPPRYCMTASPNLAKPNYLHLDDDLRDLVIQCTSTNRDDRPNLEALCNIISLNMGTKTETYYRQAPYSRWERERAVQNYVQQMIFYGSDDEAQHSDDDDGGNDDEDIIL